MKSSRLSAATKLSAVRRFFHTICLYSSIQGGIQIVDEGLENIERGLFTNIMSQVVEPKVSQFVEMCSGTELRTMIVGGTRILTESNLVTSNLEVWGKLVKSLVLIVIASEKKPVGAISITGATMLSAFEGGQILPNPANSIQLILNLSTQHCRLRNQPQR